MPTKFRFCVRPRKLYAKTELWHAFLDAKFRICVRPRKLYADAELYTELGTLGAAVTLTLAPDNDARANRPVLGGSGPW